MVIPVLTLGILGLLFGLALAYASIRFAVNEDPRLKDILAALPGTNCGACGSAGCRAFSERLLKKEVDASGCVAGGVPVAQKLSSLLGVSAVKKVKKMAVLHCGAGISKRTRIASYDGIATCKAANLILGGELACSYACLGYGDCSRICPFDAITMKDGLPKVDAQKCRACGKCLAVCPKKLFTLEPFETPLVAVACASLDKGAFVKKVCEVGCIACKICEKECPCVFTIEDNLARIDYTKQAPDTNWGAAIEKCPQHTITRCA
ncbi:MAG: RnfABCDGE type electron transport complex subunit B [Candidatus Omnitrophota bacterium]